MSISIHPVGAGEAPLDLLLSADPSLTKVHGYLADGECFVAREEETVVGAGVLLRRDAATFELMNIAVDPAYQQRRIGSRMLEWAIDRCRKDGAAVLEVGTGSFGYQLTFYQRHGFRMHAIDSDFFVRHYDEPIVEHGIRLRDMVRLRLVL